MAAELAWDPAINSDAVGVAVENGVVTVTGHLDNFAEKFAIERTLRRVHGVRAIALELDVKLSPRHRRNDTELAIAIEEALQCNTACSLDKLRVTVESGWVTLTADVDWGVSAPCHRERGSSPHRRRRRQQQDLAASAHNPR